MKTEREKLTIQCPSHPVEGVAQLSTFLGVVQYRGIIYTYTANPTVRLKSIPPVKLVTSLS